MMAKAPFAGAVRLRRQLAAVGHDAKSSIRTVLSKGADEIVAHVGVPAPWLSGGTPEPRCKEAGGQELAVSIATEVRTSSLEPSSANYCETQGPVTAQARQSSSVPREDRRGIGHEEYEHEATGRRSDPVESALLSERQALISCSDISSVVGTRICLYDEPPGTASYPCIRIGSSHRTNHGLAFTVDVFAEDQETSASLVGKIQGALCAPTRSAPVVHLKTMTHQIGSAKAPLYVSIATFEKSFESSISGA